MRARSRLASRSSSFSWELSPPRPSSSSHVWRHLDRLVSWALHVSLVHLVLALSPLDETSTHLLFFLLLLSLTFHATSTRADGHLPLPDHRNADHLVDELNLQYLYHLLDSLDEGDPSVRNCPCGHWSRASNGRSWSHALDNKSAMSIRGLGCALHVLRMKSQLYRLNNNGRIFQDGCCDEYGSFRFCRKTRSDLDRLNDFRLCHLTDRCSAQALRGLGALDHLGLWGLNRLLNDLQLWNLLNLHGYQSDVSSTSCNCGTTIVFCTVWIIVVRSLGTVHQHGWCPFAAASLRRHPTPTEVSKSHRQQLLQVWKSASHHRL